MKPPGKIKAALPHVDDQSLGGLCRGRTEVEVAESKVVDVDARTVAQAIVLKTVFSIETTVDLKLGRCGKVSI